MTTPAPKSGAKYLLILIPVLLIAAFAFVVNSKDKKNQSNVQTATDFVTLGTAMAHWGTSAKDRQNTTAFIESLRETAINTLEKESGNGYSVEDVTFDLTTNELEISVQGTHKVLRNKFYVATAGVIIPIGEALNPTCDLKAQPDGTQICIPEDRCELIETVKDGPYCMHAGGLRLSK